MSMAIAPEQTEAACTEPAHHWMLPEQNGADGVARCKHCGAEKSMPNSVQTIDWVRQSEQTFDADQRTKRAASGSTQQENFATGPTFASLRDRVLGKASGGMSRDEIVEAIRVEGGDDSTHFAVRVAQIMRHAIPRMGHEEQSHLHPSWLGSPPPTAQPSVPQEQEGTPPNEGGLADQLQALIGRLDADHKRIQENVAALAIQLRTKGDEIAAVRRTLALLEQAP